jgi:lysine 6-dehydrogenase
MRFLVLGGGAQGSACAFELLQREDVERVVLADVDPGEPRAFLKPFLGAKLELRQLDVADSSRVRSEMENADAVACALPYYLNLPMTKLAIEAGAHFCDLGGNTEIVNAQLELSGSAEQAAVSVVPDCGVAPGMVNILAQGGIDALDVTDSVRIFVGGLPRNPEPPLNYQVVYSMEGVLDYYTTPVLALEDGEVVEKEPLAEIERVEFPAPVGELEAFCTAGGISRMPYRYEGTIQNMSYKTLRYPGHARLMEAIRDLGLLDTEPVQVDGCVVVPRDLFIKVVSPRITKPDAEDMVVLRVEVSGSREDDPAVVAYEMIDYRDTENGISAMMRTTGYSLAVTSWFQAGSLIEPGVHTPAECVPLERYLEELAGRGVRIERSDR